ncbi:MAG: ComF family protein [Cyanobacteria bacterium J06600_6]
MLNQLLSVFLESPCAFCDRSTANYLCEYCQPSLSSHQLMRENRLELYQAQSTFAWGKYDGQLKRAIARMKYEQKPQIAEMLGTLLGKAWSDADLTKPDFKITVVPIPMHPQKQRLRGFNQAEIIARSFCQVTGYQLQTQTLIRIRATAAMFELKNTQERAKNLDGALRVGAKLPKHPVLLIDDIHTTGTTVKEATKMLRQKKIRVIGVAVAAKAGWL